LWTPCIAAQILRGQGGDIVMAVPARKFEMEDSVEERIARLEATTEHIQSDVSEIKEGLKRLDAKLDENYQRLDAKLDESTKRFDAKLDESTKRFDAKLDESTKRLDAKLDESTKRLDAKLDESTKRLDTKLDALKDAFASLRIGRALDKVWALLAMAALLGVMARGFKWI
jgi:exonuclease VII large subunit